jgi:hypothetical protein
VCGDTSDERCRSMAASLIVIGDDLLGRHRPGEPAIQQALAASLSMKQKHKHASRGVPKPTSTQHTVKLCFKNMLNSVGASPCSDKSGTHYMVKVVQGHMVDRDDMELLCT